MGLGGKLLMAQLGAGLARGPLAAQENEMKMLQQRLAQQFSLEQINARNEGARENALFSAQLQSETDPEAMAALGGNAGMAHRNVLQNQALEAEAIRAQVQAEVAQGTRDATIREAIARADGAVQQLGMTELQMDQLEVQNKWTKLQTAQFAEMMPLMVQAQKLDNQLKGTDARLRAAYQQSAIMLNEAQAGRLNDAAAYDRARAAAANLESELMRNAGIAGISPEDRAEYARLAVSVQTRGAAVMQQYETFMNMMRENRTPENVEEFLSGLDFSGIVGPDGTTVDQTRIRTSLKEALTRDIGSAWWPGEVNLLLSDALTEGLSSAGIPLQAAQAFEVIRDAMFRMHQLNPKAVQNASDFLSQTFPSAGPALPPGTEEIGTAIPDPGGLGGAGAAGGAPNGVDPMMFMQFMQQAMPDQADALMQAYRQAQGIQ